MLYNFAVAIDDLDAEITHVVRGEDHLSNTPKQMLVLKALGVAPPRYAHLPLLHGPDGRKLSKRHGAASVQELRDGGYLPEAVNNYIALLGAGFAADEEHFSLTELAERFRLERVSKNAAVFDERKLRHFNGQHLRELDTAELTRRLEAFTGRDGLAGAVAISREKIQTLADFWPLVGFVFDGPADDPAAFAKTIGTEEGRAGLLAAREALAAVDPFSPEALEPRPARRGRCPGTQARQAVSAHPGGARRSDRFSRYLRDPCPARTGGEPGPDRRRPAACRRAWRRARQSVLNRDRISADRWANGCGYADQAIAACARATREGRVS